MAKDLPKDPLAALRVLTESEHQLERIRREQVVVARAAGASWQQIGDALGVFPQDGPGGLHRGDPGRVGRQPRANNALTEDDALNLAVEEVRAVRRRDTTS